jgi:hypothetical protein
MRGVIMVALSKGGLGILAAGAALLASMAQQSVAKEAMLMNCIGP